MGNHKFRLTDMIPNAWLYKLKDMRRRGSRKQSTMPTKRRSLQSSPRPLPSPKAANKLVPNRASYYISSRTDAEKWYAPSVDGGHCKASDAQLILDTPRRSKRMSRVKPITTRASAKTAAAAAGCGCRSWKTESIPEFGLPASPESPSCQRDYYIDGEAPPPVLHKTNASNPCGCKISSSPADIIIDVSCKKSPEKLKELTLPESDVELPPILTKLAKKESGPVKFEDEDVDVDAKGKGKCHIVGAAPVKAKSSRIQEKRSSSASSSAGPYRLRMRANSPRLAGKKALQYPRRGRKGAPSAPPPAAAMQDRSGFSESFAVVKSSSDPQRDFRESMLEMIVELDMHTSKDLEDLLVCYLLLNSGEYHDVIVEAFQQIWLDLTDIN